MRLPFVSREMHDALVAAAVGRAVAAEAHVVTLQEQVERMLALVCVKETPRALPDRQDADPLTAIIRSRAGNNGQVRRALGQYVKNARAQGVDETAIIKGLTEWQSSDDEGVD